MGPHDVKFPGTTPPHRTSSTYGNKWLHEKEGCAVQSTHHQNSLHNHKKKRKKKQRPNGTSFDPVTPTASMEVESYARQQDRGAEDT
jgi:hypothetical protein